MNTKRILYCKRINTTIILLLLLFSHGSNTIADNYHFSLDGLYQKNLVESPEATAIKYQFFHPVNYSTGKVDIRIPLFEVECGSLTLPIYLTYNTEGIKINEPCGWVGQNWILHAEPILTRSVKGHIDKAWKTDVDRSQNDYTEAKEYLSNNFFSSFDSMPDEYYYSLLSGGGMFMYAKKSQDSINGDFVCIPYDDTKINNPLNLTTSNGTTYFYNGAIDYSSIPTRYPIAWHASKVIGSNGTDSISFTYANVVNSVIKRNEEYITVVDNIENTYTYNHSYTNRTEAVMGEPFDPEMSMPLPIIYVTHNDITESYLYLNNKLVSDSGPKEKQHYYPDITIENSHLSHIRYRGNDIEFITDKKTRNFLKQIIVRNTFAKKIKVIDFVYNSCNGRQYLSSIRNHSEDDSLGENYYFDYTNYDIPYYGSRNIDFWGYYNCANIEYDSTLVPSMKLYTSVYGNTRDDMVDMKEDSITLGSTKKRGSNEIYSTNGMLKSITYPTGAKETFLFESNRARIEPIVTNYGKSVFKISKQLHGTNGIYQLGGLRIKEIIIEDSIGVLQRRSFLYGENEDGAGTTPLRDGINYFLKVQNKIYPKHPDIPLFYARASYRTLSSSPIYPISFYNGASVMYSKVTEYNGTQENNTKKTIYHYSLPEDNVDFITELDLWDPNIKYHTWYQDNLISKEIYEKEGDNYILRQSDIYSYHNMNKNGYSVYGRQYRIDTYENLPYEQINDVRNLISFSCKNYQEPIYTNLISSHSHCDYLENGNLTTTTYFGYGQNDNVLIRKSICYSNDGQYDETISEYYQHPKDMGNCEPYSSMVSKNILTPYTKTQYYYNGNLCKEEHVEFDVFSDSMYLPSKQFYRTPEMSNPVLMNTCSYDENGCPTIVTEKENAKAIIWDEHGQRILGIIQVSKSDTSNTSFSIFINECTRRLRASEYAYSDSTLVNIDDLENNYNGKIHIYLFGYDSYGRLAYVKAPNGKIRRYDYDGLHRLIGIRNTSNQILEEYVYHNVNIN